VASDLLSVLLMRCKHAWLLLALAGCDEGAPPYDELPLRDALRADPAVLAALPDAARARLASRFEAARSTDGTVDSLANDPATTPPERVAEMDRARQRRQAEPLIVGLVSQGSAWSLGADTELAIPLPPLEGASTTATAELESRGLAGRAGVELRSLVAASGARHLQRVVGWPIGAVAVDDTVYVNASWLVALAPRENADGGSPADGGGTGSSSSGSGANPVAVVPATSASASDDTPAGVVKGRPAPGYSPDAGNAPQRTPYPSESEDPAAAELCDACAEGCAQCDVQTCTDESSYDDSYGGGEYDSSTDPCAASADDGGDPYAVGADDSAGACDAGDGSTADSCNGDYSEGGDACASAGEGMDGGAECQVGRRRQTKSSRTLAWLLSPIGYLAFRRRS
jgi:hypothetical protein